MMTAETDDAPEELDIGVSGFIRTAISGTAQGQFAGRVEFSRRPVSSNPRTVSKE
jgi:hypothetical protein